jgi:glycosidase
MKKLSGRVLVLLASLLLVLGLLASYVSALAAPSAASDWSFLFPRLMQPDAAWGSHTTITQGPSGGADCNIMWNEVLHDTFDPNYRSLVGPIAAGITDTLRLRLRVAQSDLTSARVRVWNDRTDTETYYNLAWDGVFDQDPTTYDWWFADIPLGSQPTILYYFFELNDAGGSCSPADQDWYTDDDIKFYGGGYGGMSDNYNDAKSFQATVYDPAFNVPTWMQRGVVYQVFPDRFRDGDPANNRPAGSYVYGADSIVRSLTDNWNTILCDPRVSGSPCYWHWGDNFYGGDLAGITEKINAGYFDNLGVSVIYLNPIFRSVTNHKYDAADYMLVDPDFGTLTDFQILVAAANAHGIQIILDGVFNHTSSDSRYFDYDFRYDAAGNLTSPNGAGTNDGSGACESLSSPYASWYYWDPLYNVAPLPCYNGPGGEPHDYEGWYSFGSLPKLQAGSTAVRALIFSDGLASVGPYWTSQGAAGWRFDVGDEIDPGLTQAPTNDYWESFRLAVRNPAVTGRSDTLLLGEVWGDASALLLGNEWDSVMNYRFRSAVLSWLFTGCSGNGCTNGTMFEDNDSNNYNGGSSSGPISLLTPSQFNARLLAIWEDYPPMAWKAMLNLEGSHDTNRLRFLLRKINGDNDGAAVQRMKEWWLFSFTYAGAPTIYYGDEVGLSQDGAWVVYADKSTYEDDPYNRAPFPWDDTPGDFTADTANLLPHARQMTSIRLSYRALQDGDVKHGIVIDDSKMLYGFARYNDEEVAIIVLNRSSQNHLVVLSGLNTAPYNLSDGAVLLDALNNQTYVVTGGQITVTVNSSWGVILLEQSKIETPAAPADLAFQPIGNDLKLTWSLVATDTAAGREVATHYTLHRSTSSTFTPGPANQIADLTPPNFGSPNGQLAYTDPGARGPAYYYSVCALNAAGKYSCSAPMAAPQTSDIFVPLVVCTR